MYMVIGGLLGALSAFLTLIGVPNSVILIMYILVVYATTHLYHLVGVSFDRMGETRIRATLGGVMPSLLPWLVIWTMIFYLISPVIILADMSHAQAAEDLEEYFVSSGIRAKISDDYPRHISARRVVILGSRVLLPLGTSYGVTIVSDAVQQFLILEKDKGTIEITNLDSGELITVKKAMRVIIIISGPDNVIDQIVQENRERIYSLL